MVIYFVHVECTFIVLSREAYDKGTSSEIGNSTSPTLMRIHTTHVHLQVHTAREGFPLEQMLYRSTFVHYPLMWCVECTKNVKSL